ncbi:hypothetical protein KC323_g219 [Hortaea werneckii]|nr:hypothetical protein KC323_g219 [Hortaea werneckii]
MTFFFFFVLSCFFSFACALITLLTTSVWQNCSHTWRWRSRPAKQIEIRVCAPENVIKVFASVTILYSDDPPEL